MKFKKEVRATIKLNQDEIDRLYSILRACTNMNSDQFLQALYFELQSCNASFVEDWQGVGRYSINYGYEDIPF